MWRNSAKVFSCQCAKRGAIFAAILVLVLGTLLIHENPDFLNHTPQWIPLPPRVTVTARIPTAASNPGADGEGPRGRDSSRSHSFPPCSSAIPSRSTLPRNTSFIVQCRHMSMNAQPRGTVLSTSSTVRELMRNKLFLFYYLPSGFWGLDFDLILRKCKIQACSFTFDKSLLREADAVVVHASRLHDPQPPALARNRRGKQIWIAFAFESPVHYEGYHGSPAWKSVFNWTLTYRLDADIFTPYGLLTVRTQPSGKNYTAIAQAKKKYVAWFVTNCEIQSLREVYVRRLQEYIDVDVYGGCSPLKCSRDDESECLQLLNSTYHFYLSFENSFCRDYVTEKFFKCFDNVDIIPVVRGGFDYRKYVDTSTFINTADFHTPKQLALFLKRLANDKGAYAEMLEAKDKYLNDPAYNSVENAMCEMCERLNSPNIREKQYTNCMQWASRSMCWEPTDIKQK